MLPTHQRLFSDDAGNWILSQQDVDSVPGAGELEGDAEAEFVKQYYDKREREETEGQVEMFEHWVEERKIEKAKALPLQEPQTAPAGTQENGGEADDASQQENGKAQPGANAPKPEREHLLPRCDVPDRKMLPEFASQHWKNFAGITDACDLRYEGNDLSTLRVASSYAVPRINDKPFTLDPQLIQMADNGTRYQDLSSVKRSMKALHIGIEACARQLRRKHSR